MPIPRETVLSELFFMQNYGRPLWVHEWSLAVEEHFYLLLPLALVLMQRGRSAATRPFDFLPTLVGLIAAVVLTLRIGTAALFPFNRQNDLYATHLRIDALAFGVLLCYLQQFYFEQFGKFVRERYWLLVAATVALLTPFLFLDFELPITRTIGLTISYLGLGALLLVTLYSSWQAPASLAPGTRACGRLMAFIGRNSYGIYLWHLPVRDCIIAKLLAVGWLRHGTDLEFLLYAGLSIAVGTIATLAVEAPVLAWRDRLMPSRRMSAAVAVTS